MTPIGRRYSTYIDPLTLSRSSRILRILSNLKNEPLEYVDDIIFGVQKAIEDNRLFPYGKGLKLIQYNDIVSSIDIEKNVRVVEQILNYIFLTFSTLPNYLNQLAQTIESTIGDSTDKIKYIQNIKNTIEVEAKKKRNASSIKNEIRFVESFVQEGSIEATTLAIDTSSGNVTLNPTTSEILGYGIESIFVKGQIPKLNIPHSVDTEIIDGYYFGSFFEKIPRFETRSLNNRNDPSPAANEISTLNDSDSESTFEIEYVTVNSDKPLEVTIKLKIPGTQTLDQVLIESNNFGQNKWISLSKIILDGNDITENILGKGIRVKESLVVEPDTEIKPNKKSPYPSASFNIPKTYASSLELTFTQKSFYKLRIPMMRKVSPRGETIKEYTYLESFILRNGIGESGKFSPYLLTYNSNDLNTEYDDSNRIEEYEQIKNRYAIGLREIMLKTMAYESSGSLITKTYSAPKDIISIELYADESIPEGSSIQYKIILDNETSVDIIPVNREIESGNKRIVLDPNFELSANELFISKNINTFKVQIDMSGSETPILHGLLFRVKVED